MQPSVGTIPISTQNQRLFAELQPYNTLVQQYTINNVKFYHLKTAVTPSFHNSFYRVKALQESTIPMDYSLSIH
jgi:hypothetical protein